jgi:hypothetical protein
MLLVWRHWDPKMQVATKAPQLPTKLPSSLRYAVTSATKLATLLCPDALRGRDYEGQANVHTPG